MGVAVDPRGTPGRVNSTDLARWIALREQRKTVGLTEANREEYKLLGQKINEVKHGTDAADA